MLFPDHQLAKLKLVLLVRLQNILLHALGWKILLYYVSRLRTLLRTLSVTPDFETSIEGGTNVLFASLLFNVRRRAAIFTERIANLLPCLLEVRTFYPGTAVARQNVYADSFIRLLEKEARRADN